MVGNRDRQKQDGVYLETQLTKLDTGVTTTTEFLIAKNNIYENTAQQRTTALPSAKTGSTLWNYDHQQVLLDGIYFSSEQVTFHFWFLGAKVPLKQKCFDRFDENTCLSVNVCGAFQLERKGFDAIRSNIPRAFLFLYDSL